MEIKNQKDIDEKELSDITEDNFVEIYTHIILK